MSKPDEPVRTRMTHAEFYKLCHWLEMHGHKFRELQTPYPEVCGQACADLKRAVTNDQLAEARQVTGINWLPKRTANPSKHGGRQYVAWRAGVDDAIKIICSRLDALEQQRASDNTGTELAGIRACLAKVFLELGIQPPPNSTVCVANKIGVLNKQS